MKIERMFNKSISRPIDGVVKADDGKNLEVEVDEYVLTNDAAKSVAPMMDVYNEYTNANGVWISGFFGSGKSHLLKMLAHLLGDVPGQEYPRERVYQAFTQKTDDEMLLAAMQRAVHIPAQSLLFNIDQKSDVVSKDARDSLLRVFLKVFNEARGYYGAEGPVARFEADLDRRGQLEQFKEAYLQTTGKDWTIGREETILGAAEVDEVFSQIEGKQVTGIMSQYREAYSVTIEDFAEEVREWVDKKREEIGKEFRLNFFVDEVGQYIADNVQLMLSLQTIAESLNTKCQGRSWVFLTSQEDLEKVVGDRSQQQANDFSKIQGRFSTKVKLTSQNVEEVIAKRLLAKTEEARAQLHLLYQQQHANFGTLFTFADGSQSYRNYPDEEDFIKVYPFVNYQFPLFQKAVMAMSDHNMFEGRNRSVGERSMLEVAQKVVMQIGGCGIGQLVSFDKMYDAIEGGLLSGARSAIDQADKHLPSDSPVRDLALRVLRALFLVKYDDGFKATARNLQVLLLDSFDTNTKEMLGNIQEALTLLEVQSYVQRSGDVYEFLTNEEQEIEKEIKALDLDPSRISSRLVSTLTNDVLKTKKLKYELNGQDFNFGYILDDIVQGRQEDLYIHFITPESGHSLDVIRSQSLGSNQLRVVLSPADINLMADLRLMEKTDKYIKQRTSGNIAQSTQAILQTKRSLNTEREKEFITKLREALGRAVLVVNGQILEVKATEAVARITEGFQVLIAQTYTHLRLLGGRTYSEDTVLNVLLEEDSLLDTSQYSTLSIPGEEIAGWVSMASDKGEQVTIRKVTDRFSAVPYGWDLASIESAVAWLVRSGKISLTMDGNPIPRAEASTVIRTTTKHQYAVLASQRQYDQNRVRELSIFAKDFFNIGRIPSDPVELGQFVKSRLLEKSHQLDEAIAQQDRFPFVQALSAARNNLVELSAKSVEWFLTEFRQGDDLLDIKDNLLDPIAQFLQGTGGEIFSEATKYLTQNSANIASFAVEHGNRVAELLDDPNIFRGNRAAELRSSLENLKVSVTHGLNNRRKEILEHIVRRTEYILESENFELASEIAQRSVKKQLDKLKIALENENQIATLLTSEKDFDENQYPRLLAELADSVLLKPKQQSSQDSVVEAETSVKYVSLHSIQVTSPKAVLSSEEDIDEYLSVWRAALAAALREGKRITP